MQAGDPGSRLLPLFMFTTLSGQRLKTAFTLECLTVPHPLRYASTETHVTWLLGQLLLAKPAVVGFDIEWRVNNMSGATKWRGIEDAAASGHVLACVLSAPLA